MPPTGVRASAANKGRQLFYGLERDGVSAANDGQRYCPAIWSTGDPRGGGTRRIFRFLPRIFATAHEPLGEGLRESVLFPLPNGLTLGVFGLTSSFDGLYEVFGLHFPDTDKVARRCVERLRTQGAEPIILLSHLGLAEDRQLAERVIGMDVIIGAHTHDCLPEGEIHAKVLIAQAGEYAAGLGRCGFDAGRCGTGRRMRRTGADCACGSNA